tara:strand:- start:175 stop:1185 length:1011 start_codon:yes stop_codon:yes gene_type:complete
MQTSKKIFIRIGSDKAGTVSLAYLVGNNKDKFKSHGVLAPSRNCLSLFHYLTDKFSLADIGNWEDREPNRVAGISDLIARIEAGERISDNIFLTTETLWGRLTKRNLDPINKSVRILLQSLLEMFPDHQPQIIIHIRRIDLYLESLYKQEVKAGRSQNFKNLIRRATADRAFDFLKILEDVFGVENIIIRPFERSQLFNGCVVQDTLNTLGLSEYIHEYKIVLGNDGLHRDLMETLINLNSRYGKILPNRQLLEINDLLKNVLKYEDVKHILPLKTRLDCLKEHRKFYEYLAQKYTGSSSLFNEPLPDDSHLDYRLKPDRELLIEKLIFQIAEQSR